MKRKRGIWFFSKTFLILITLILCGSGVFAQEPIYKALNPRATRPEVKQFPLTPRASDLSNKVVYVISQHVGDADIFLKKVANALPKYFPGVKAIYKDKPSAYMTDDPELWNEVAKNANAFVFG
jgi:hypothetical protein